MTHYALLLSDTAGYTKVMQEITQAIAIHCSVKKAFDFILNPKNTPKWVANIIQEQVNEVPTRLGTIYKNQSHDGGWREFRVTTFEAPLLFEMAEKGSHVYVRYTFTTLDDNQCQLEYSVRAAEGELSEAFNEVNLRKILQKLKRVIEK